MNKASTFQKVVVSILSVVLIVLIVFYGYRPTSYDLAVGSVSNRDIYAQRSFIDTYQTEYEAVLAKNSVSPIFIRSDEISAQSINNVELFYTIVKEARNNRLDNFGMPADDWDQTVRNMHAQIEQEFTSIPDDATFDALLSMSSSAFNLLWDKSVSIAEIIMMDNVNTDTLNSAIDFRVSQFEENYTEFSSYSEAMADVLSSVMTPNSVFDSDATQEAGENAYITIMNSPITVDKGTKLISAGEVVTEHMYQNLVDLELVRSDSSDILILARITAYIVILAIVLSVYYKRRASRTVTDMRIFYALVITYIIPIVASVYLSEFSALMIVSLFFTTIASTYLGTREGIVLSLIEAVMMWPLYSFDSEYIFVSLIGIIITATIAGRVNRSYNSASLIIMPSLGCLFAVVIYNAIFSEPLSGYIETVVWTGVSALLSIILAIGIMPIVELFSRVVSPVKLLELSQPGNPLLKRLFMEAPGTYSHSMMVSSLADAAADAVGADALFCRVASYFHDIGKLENPVFFTENQTEGFNPHDGLTVMDSVNIITAHTLDGVKLAHKYHLPDSFIEVIEEHHGTTYPGYFYHMACVDAEAQGLPAPDVEEFKYKGRIPSSKESAIIMIADTCEAAIRSNKLTDATEIENLIRKLIKGKIDQDQLNNSGLSFDDIEKIIVAIKRVYAGSLHERIQYPS
ncbi:MAG: HDIG domain-containing protein [Clostridiales bacterium]|nr:HDIG domain-containing protein [Clostridiales bacterium]